jgi:hypothetical protein
VDRLYVVRLSVTIWPEGIDPMELFQMINGKAVPTKQVTAGLA